MKRTTPYILLALVAVALIALFITGTGRKKKLDERVTFRKKDKIPYGTWVAFQSLPRLFPYASVYVSRKEPGTWDALSEDSSGQLLIAVTPRFMADEYEMRRLISFVENGNDVFISTRYVSADVEEMMDCSVFDSDLSLLFGQNNAMFSGLADSMELRLKKPPYISAYKYSYPGKDLSSSFTRINTSTTDELGFNNNGAANFIHLKAGKGNFYLHLAPLAFSNYFLLHKNNIGYYEKALSVINPHVTKIAWDEYYLNKRGEGQGRKKKSWITVLSRYPGLKAALLTALITLALFLLLEMRRKQRYIPVVTRPRNDSLDFVKTIGRLYYDRSDHKNLCQKMGAYFLEHVRSRYKLATGNLDDTFIKNLQFKTGVDETDIRSIVSNIKYANDAPAVSPAEVTEFHRQLESFYKKA